jgi:hypothetical protein
MHHFIWKNLELWEDIIELAIADESKNVENFGLGEGSGTESEKFGKQKTVIFAQLNSYSYIMINYN